MFKRVKKNFLRQPILVVDSAVVSQTKINRSIKFLNHYHDSFDSFYQWNDAIENTRHNKTNSALWIAHIFVNMVLRSLIFKSKILGQKLIIF